MRPIDFLIATDPSGGEARLTNQSASSRYGIPVFEITGQGIEESYGPADLIDHSVVGGCLLPAAFTIVGWAREPERTPEEIEAAREFLQQWPEGPQI